MHANGSKKVIGILDHCCRAFSLGKKFVFWIENLNATKVLECGEIWRCPCFSRLWMFRVGDAGRERVRSGLAQRPLVLVSFDKKSEPDRYRSHFTESSLGRGTWSTAGRILCLNTHLMHWHKTSFSSEQTHRIVMKVIFWAIFLLGQFARHVIRCHFMLQGVAPEKSYFCLTFGTRVSFSASLLIWCLIVCAALPVTLHKTKGSAYPDLVVISSWMLQGPSGSRHISTRIHRFLTELHPKRNAKMEHQVHASFLQAVHTYGT